MLAQPTIAAPRGRDLLAFPQGVVIVLFRVVEEVEIQKKKGHWEKVREGK